jgi:putative restriction endonuclease
VDWVERIAGIRRWRRDGRRAPHKPLLLLYALGRFQREGPGEIAFSAAEAHLDGLLREFGPPNATTSAYPFHHLTGDGVWTVRTLDGPGSPGARVTLLRGRDARGRLSPDLTAALVDDPRLAGRIARSLLDAEFPPSLHADICRLAGVDPDLAAPAAAGPPAPARDPAFRDRVLRAYGERCAFCGFDGRVDRVAVGLEAAHVRWWSFDGPNDADNGLCLCALHHQLFDRGVLGLTPGRTVAVSARFSGTGATARDHVLALDGRPVAEPLTGFPPVHADHVAWHGTEVFRAPARAAGARVG